MMDYSLIACLFVFGSVCYLIRRCCNFFSPPQRIEVPQEPQEPQKIRISHRERSIVLACVIREELNEVRMTLLPEDIKFQDKARFLIFSSVFHDYVHNGHAITDIQYHVRFQGVIESFFQWVFNTNEIVGVYPTFPKGTPVPGRQWDLAQFVRPDFSYQYVERWGNKRAAKPEYKLNLDEWNDYRDHLREWFRRFLRNYLLPTMSGGPRRTNFLRITDMRN